MSDARARHEQGDRSVRWQRRIGLFLPSLAGGGAERVMLDLGAVFADRGHRVRLFVATRSGERDGAWRDEALRNGLDPVDLRASRTASAGPSLVQELHRTGTEVLLSTLEHANTVALMARAFVPGLRVVVREANVVDVDLAGDRSGLGWRERLLLQAMRATYPGADAVVAVSDGVADALRRVVGVPEQRVATVPNPAVTPRLWLGSSRAVRHPWFRPGEPPVLLGMGRLAPQKDFASMVEAFGMARKRTDARLVILGEGPERADLEALVRSLGLTAAVDLPGFEPEPFAMLKRAGAFVSSSRWEGMPNVLIQARALGTPVVATNCRSGPAEVLENGRHGRLVPVGDVAALADAMVAALAEGRRPVEQAWLDRYRVESVADRYLEIMVGDAR